MRPTETCSRCNNPGLRKHMAGTPERPLCRSCRLPKLKPGAAKQSTIQRLFGGQRVTNDR